MLLAPRRVDSTAGPVASLPTVRRATRGSRPAIAPPARAGMLPGVIDRIETVLLTLLSVLNLMALFLGLTCLAVGAFFAWGAWTIPNPIGAACAVTALGCMWVGGWAIWPIVEDVRDRPAD